MNTSEIYSIVLALITAAAAGLVGSFALLKKTALAGDAMSHIALPGIGLALLFKINPLLGAGATLFAGTILIWQLQKKTGLSNDAMIGVIFATSLALGALLTPSEDLMEALFGGFGNIHFLEFFVGFIAALIVIVFVGKYKDKLILILFSPDLAAVSKVNVNRTNLYFLLVFSLTIVLGLRVLGALLAGTLLIIPAATGRQLTHTLSAFLIASSASSVAAVGGGIFLSRVYHAETGPTIICVAAFTFFLSLLKKHSY
jgi:ABC-type Mn2+/Zn2+ transport system permease subunit